MGADGLRHSSKMPRLPKQSRAETPILQLLRLEYPVPLLRDGQFGEAYTRPDRVDRLLVNPFRILQRVAGGTLFHCEPCRIQFHDLRRQISTASAKSDVCPEPISTA